MASVNDGESDPIWGQEYVLHSGSLRAGWCQEKQECPVISMTRNPQTVMGDVAECAGFGGELESPCLAKVF